MNKTTTVLVTTVVLGLVLSGCGSSSEDTRGTGSTTTVAVEDTTSTSTSAPAAAPTTTEFCTAARAAFGDYQPGFDAIFEEHPDPTLEDWAAFLPEPIKEFDDVIAALEEVEPSEEVADDFRRALAAMRTVSDDLHASLDAAKAGDQAAYDAAEAANQGSEDASGEVQGGDTDAMGAALDKVIARCGGPS